MKELDPYNDAESYGEFQLRLERGIAKILENANEMTDILIVTHGNTIRHIVNKISLDTNVFQEITNSSVTILEYQDKKLRLLAFNQ